MEFGGYLIDWRPLLDYDFCCEPDKCQENNSYCCAKFEVDLSLEETKRVIGLMPKAVRYCDYLVDDDNALINPFDEEGGVIYLDKNDDGDCVFTFVDSKKGEKLCALHTACLYLGLDPSVEKPLPCAIWPLFIGDEDENGKRPVGLDLDSNPVCLTEKKSGDRKVSEGVKGLLTGLFKNDVGVVVADIERQGFPRSKA